MLITKYLLRPLLLTVAIVTVPAGNCQERGVHVVSIDTESGESLSFGRFHALIIGNNDYRHLNRLKTAEADATALANILRDKYGFQVTLLLNADRESTIRSIYEFRAKLTSEDNLLIYYAGHGVLDEANQKGYWQPVDAVPALNDIYAIKASTINDQLDAINAKRVIVIADSCYSGSILERSSNQQPKTAQTQDVWLKRIANLGSRTALTSGGLTPVLDGGGDGHSVFAQALLDLLISNKIVISGDQVYDRIKGVVAAKAEQMPRYDSIISPKNDDYGDFVFVPKQVQDEQAVPQIKELKFWLGIRDCKDPKCFEDYLEQFPRGTYKELAVALATHFGTQAEYSSGATENHTTQNTETAKDPNEDLRDLVAKFYSAERKIWSQKLAALYKKEEGSRDAIISSLIGALLPITDLKSYRVNLYIALTLEKIDPYWAGDEEQKARVSKLTKTRNYKDKTFKKRVDGALANFRAKS